MGVKKFLPIVVVALLAVALVAPAAVIGAPEALATRTLPASVAPGADFDVSIEASGCGLFGQVVETLPSGFSYVSCASTDVSVTQVDNTVKFTFIGDPVSFSYTVTASATEGTYSFSGTVKDEDKIEYTIGGDIQVEVSAVPKGDFDGDGDIDLADFVEFASAYGSSTGDPNYSVIGDFNDDGDIDLTDFVAFAEVYGS